MANSTYTIEIKGLDAMLSMYSKAPQVIEPILQKAIVKSTAILAEKTVPGNVPWVTGTLARSFDPAQIERLLARWFPRVEYARGVQFGMDPSPGRFVPGLGKSGKGARLVNTVTKTGKQKDIGIWPGFKGRHYMEQIRSASTSKINELFNNAVKAATAALSTK
jgi:hypothetical protein